METTAFLHKLDLDICSPAAWQKDAPVLFARCSFTRQVVLNAADALGHHLHPEERQFYSRLKNEKRKAEFLAGRMLLKALVVEAGGCRGPKEAFNSILIRKVEHGEKKGMPCHLTKDGGTGFSVSLSHCEEIVFAALTPSGAIGIDVETALPESVHSSRFFVTHEEKKFIESDLYLRGRSRREKSLLLWCCKEAVGKSLGTGLKYGLRSFSFYAFQENATGMTSKLCIHGSADKPEAGLSLPQAVFHIYFAFEGSYCYVAAHLCRGSFR